MSLRGAKARDVLAWLAYVHRGVVIDPDYDCPAVPTNAPGKEKDGRVMSIGRSIEGEDSLRAKLNKMSGPNHFALSLGEFLEEVSGSERLSIVLAPGVDAKAALKQRVRFDDEGRIPLKDVIDGVLSQCGLRLSIKWGAVFIVPSVKDKF